jgi:hypothetical protein
MVTKNCRTNNGKRKQDGSLPPSATISCHLSSFSFSALLPNVVPLAI